ncbi:MAG: hypothetical protein IJO32_05035 [Bacilli bacterium]|nr:hypothetical protein [Bacilli bacterium]
MKEIKFQPILLASDINVYSMARAFHEEYGIKSLVIARNDSGIIKDSKILIYEEEKHMNETDVFLKKLDEIYNRYKKNEKDIKLLLIGCADHYVRLIVENKEKLKEKFIVPYTDKEILDNIVLKETFYELCEKYKLDYPKTFVYTKKTKKNFKLDFDFPVILKPSDSVEYWRAPFENQYKVFKINNREELINTLDKIYNAGYKGNMIIQDIIPGKDECMYDLHVYVGKDHRVKLMNLGNVLLEEHTPQGIGSNAATLTVYNEEIMMKVKEVLEGIKYSGWADCDLKYDSRDGKLKIFEINIRQGRSHYRVTGSGNNVAKYIVDDYIYDKKMDLKLVKEPYFWHMIPMGIVYKYVKDKEKLKIVKKLVKGKKTCNSIFYKKDLGFKRLIRFTLKYINQFVKFKKYYK